MQVLNFILKIKCSSECDRGIHPNEEAFKVTLQGLDFE